VQIPESLAAPFFQRVNSQVLKTKKEALEVQIRPLRKFSPNESGEMNRNTFDI
jgi:hypothetical protein